MSQHCISLIGNPNCGKTTLFNALTGSKQRVGNWAGVTVDKKTGEFSYRGTDVEVVDLPGIYSLTPTEVSGEDEIIARDYLLSGETELILNIVDASNLDRNLYLTAQLIELNIPMIVVVNMLDIAKHHHINVDLKALQESLGVPVVGIVASREKGIQALKNAIVEKLASPSLPQKRISYGQLIDAAVSEITPILTSDNKHGAWFTTQFLERASGLQTRFSEQTIKQVDEKVQALDVELDGALDIEIANARYDFIARAINRSVTRPSEMVATITDKIDQVVLHRWLGIPIFLCIMYVMFLFTQNFGAVFIDFFDILVGGIFVDGLGAFLGSIGCPEWLTVFLASGVGGGLQTISTFIPVVFFMFLFLAILEESGYMARAAFVMDRFMRRLGLPGKAFVPLIVGFGCSVPAIMGTRTLDRTSDRIVTVLMAPFMSCGARMPVYVLFATAFFPTNGQNIVFLLYLIGIVAAITTCFLLKRTAFPGGASPFVMEIPPYHMPTFKGVMQRTWDRVKAFITRAGQTIIVIVACLTFLNSVGTDGSFGNEDSDKSVLSSIGQTIVPIFEPMGIEKENWPAAVGVFTGLFAKEAVVGTLNSLYNTVNANEADAEGDETDFSLSETFAEAATTIGENLSDLSGALLDPMGITVDDLTDTEAAAESQEVSMGTIATIQTLFGSTSAAFAYLLLILLYMPCVAAVATIYSEVGAKWTIFAAAWTTALGYSVATIFYQTANFAANPGYAIACIAGCLALLGAMIVWMKSMSKYCKCHEKKKRVIPIKCCD